MNIPNSLRKTLLDGISIENTATMLLGNAGKQFRRVNRKIVAECPFCDSFCEASLTIDLDGRTWYCTECFRLGDAIDLISRCENLCTEKALVSEIRHRFFCGKINRGAA